MKKIVLTLGLLFLALFVNAQWNHFKSIVTYNPNPNSSSGVNNVCFVSPDVSFYSGYYYGIHDKSFDIYRALDGWNLLQARYGEGGDYYERYLSDMVFINETTGYILSGNMFQSIKKTTSGGSDFQDFYQSISPNLFFKISYPKEDLGYFLSRIDYNNQKSFKIIVSDSGRCTSKEVGSAYKDATHLRFVNDSTGYILCKDSTNRYIALRTQDSASTWQPVITSSGDRLKAMCFLTPQTGFVVTQSGILYKTTDYGLSWQQFITGATEIVNDVFFVNENEGYLACNNGLLVKTTDGGQNFELINTGINANFGRVYFAPDGRGYLLAGIELYVNFSSGVNNPDVSINDKNEFRIFPNPANGVINLDLESIAPGFTIQVFDITGKQVYGPVVTSQNSLNLDGLNKGVYLVKIENGGEARYQKLIIE